MNYRLAKTPSIRLILCLVAAAVVWGCRLIDPTVSQTAGKTAAGADLPEACLPIKADLDRLEAELLRRQSASGARMSAYECVDVAKGYCVSDSELRCQRCQCSAMDATEIVRGKTAAEVCRNRPQANPVDQASQDALRPRQQYADQCVAAGLKWVGGAMDDGCRCPDNDAVLVVYPYEYSKNAVCNAGRAKPAGALALAGAEGSKSQATGDVSALSLEDLNRAIEFKRQALTDCKQRVGSASTTAARGEALCFRVGGTVVNMNTEGTQKGCRCGTNGRSVAWDVLELDQGQSCSQEVQANPDPQVLAKACSLGNGIWEESRRQCTCGDTTFEVAGMFVGGGLDEFKDRCGKKTQTATAALSWTDLCRSAGGVLEGSLCRCGWAASYNEQILRADAASACRAEVTSVRNACKLAGGTATDSLRCGCGNQTLGGLDELANQMCRNGRWTPKTAQQGTVGAGTGTQAPTSTRRPSGGYCAEADAHCGIYVYNATTDRGEWARYSPKRYWRSDCSDYCSQLYPNYPIW